MLSLHYNEILPRRDQIIKLAQQEQPENTSHYMVEKMQDFLIPLMCYTKMQKHEKGLKVVQTVKDIVKEISSLGPNQAPIDP